jgi:hypothetical protein
VQLIIAKYSWGLHDAINIVALLQALGLLPRVPSAAAQGLAVSLLVHAVWRYDTLCDFFAPPLHAWRVVLCAYIACFTFAWHTAQIKYLASRMSNVLGVNLHFHVEQKLRFCTHYRSVAWLIPTAHLQPCLVLCLSCSRLHV